MVVVQAAKGEFLFVWAPLAEETWTCVLPTLPQRSALCLTLRHPLVIVEQ